MGWVSVHVRDGAGGWSSMGSGLVVHFLDAGQSDVVYVELPDGVTNLLIDPGTTRYLADGTVDVSAALADSVGWSWFADEPNLVRDAGTLTYLILTDASEAHCNLVEPFLRMVAEELRPGQPDLAVTWVVHGRARSDHPASESGTDLIAWLETTLRPSEHGGGTARSTDRGVIVPLARTGEEASTPAEPDTTVTVVTDGGPLALVLEHGACSIAIESAGGADGSAPWRRPDGSPVGPVDVVRIGPTSPEALALLDPLVAVLGSTVVDRDAPAARQAAALGFVERLAHSTRLSEAVTEPHTLSATSATTGLVTVSCTAPVFGGDVRLAGGAVTADFGRHLIIELGPAPGAIEVRRRGARSEQPTELALRPSPAGRPAGIEMTETLTLTPSRVVDGRPVAPSLRRTPLRPRPPRRPRRPTSSPPAQP